MRRSTLARDGARVASGPLWNLGAVTVSGTLATRGMVPGRALGNAGGTQNLRFAGHNAQSLPTLFSE